MVKMSDSDNQGGDLRPLKNHSSNSLSIFLRKYIVFSLALKRISNATLLNSEGLLRRFLLNSEGLFEIEYLALTRQAHEFSPLFAIFLWRGLIISASFSLR